MRRAEKSNVKIMLNTEATAQLVEELKPEHVIVATGSSPVAPKFIKGWERARHATDIYFKPD